MFLLRFSVSVQVSKRLFRIINKWGGPSKPLGGGGRVEKNQKLTSGWKGRLFGTQEYQYLLNVKI